jgi:hypothetical protein
MPKTLVTFAVGIRHWSFGIEKQAVSVLSSLLDPLTR